MHKDTRRALINLLLPLVAIFCLSACSAEDAAPPQPPQDLLLLSGLGELTELSLQTGERRRLLRFDGDSIFDASVSPDGKLVAFARSRNFRPDISDFGSDIYVASRDGSGAVMVAEHSFANEILRSPVWRSDSRTVVFQVQGIQAVFGLPVSRLDQVDVTSKARSVFADSGGMAIASLDGRTIAYQTVEAAGVEVLWLATEGKSSHERFLTATKALGAFGFAAPSPDGRLLALGATSLSALGRSTAVAVSTQDTSLALAGDGLPEDLWLVPLDGSAPSLLARFGEDLPYFTWSADSKFVFMIGGSGLWRITVANGEKTRIGEGVPHGRIAWLPR